MAPVPFSAVPLVGRALVSGVEVAGGVGDGVVGGEAAVVDFAVLRSMLAPVYTRWSLVIVVCGHTGLGGRYRQRNGLKRAIVFVDSHRRGEIVGVVRAFCQDAAAEERSRR